MSGVSHEEKRAVLAHYQLQAAQAAFDALAEPECSDDEQELNTLREMIEMAQCHLRSALSAVGRRDIEAVTEYVRDAVEAVEDML
jgi:hypothetical protein